MNTKNNRPAGLPGLALAAALATLASPASAMEDDGIFQATRVEVDAGRSDSKSIAAWRADGWIGTDYNRFAWRAEGSRRDGRLEDAEVQALYSRYVAPFWDLQLGLRRELKPQARNYGVIGVRGLAASSSVTNAAPHAPHAITRSRSKSNTSRKYSRNVDLISFS